MAKQKERPADWVKDSNNPQYYIAGYEIPEGLSQETLAWFTGWPIVKCYECGFRIEEHPKIPSIVTEPPKEWPPRIEIPFDREKFITWLGLPYSVSDKYKNDIDWATGKYLPGREPQNDD